MSNNILLIGGGGHCESVLDTVFDVGCYDKIGIIDRSDKVGLAVMGVPIVGCDSDLVEFFKIGYRKAFVSLGSIGCSRRRMEIFKHIKKIGYEIPSIIDPSANISSRAKISEGVFVGKNVVVNTGALINCSAIINTGSIVEHHCVIGAFTHISPGTVMGGNVRVGSNSHIGLNATIMQDLNIGENALIGMGSVVVDNIRDGVTAYGNPCREVL